MPELHDTSLAPYAISNDVPPMHLHLSAKAHLKKLEGDLHMARKRVEELKEALARAQDDVLAAEARVQPYRQLTSPVRWLPHELIARILFFTLDPFPWFPTREWIRLRLVCKKWKAVVDSSPELWRTLYLSVWLEDSCTSTMRILQRWFSHAGDQSLGLKIDLPEQYLHTEDWGELAAFLRSKRWKQLGLRGTSPEILEAAFPDSYDSSALETLEVIWVGQHGKLNADHPVYLQFPSFLQRFSQLKQLSIEWRRSKPPPEVPQFPCLTFLSLGGRVPKDYARRFLQAQPSLKEAVIGLGNMDSDSTSDEDADTPVGIKRLTLTTREWELNYMPHLEELFLQQRWYPRLASFNPRSPYSLSNLTKLRHVDLRRAGDLTPERTALLVSHLPPWVRVLLVGYVDFLPLITRRMAARGFAGRQLDIVYDYWSLYESVSGCQWSYILKHLVKVFVKKRPGRAREAFRGRDLVIWIPLELWERFLQPAEMCSVCGHLGCGYRELWKERLDQLRSVNVRIEVTLGPRPEHHVERPGRIFSLWG
ncbi:hypothetical protein CC1G_11275 [Coprinopsis cinerea okayama7|uniref:F-box domain-containing protein n=1 Tax=Coprinopsis cinerea (strain Okayama-7 / 130 / ATCC MYA-4618 / FGSC 9003) TaxID=240176 RepID=A8PDM3_COPC7|nr:hypothetical protein CC1G_11275 [Coprinopsis cinerea okayama7\|eukprot:XP_001840627.1 hypothetical protein CC1G_11275 [Coprinopsis cinerea okayama7\